MAETTKSAYRIVTERLVIRCWEPADAVLAKEAIDSSLDHLRPWMPWAARRADDARAEGAAAAPLPGQVRPRPGHGVRHLRPRRAPRGRRHRPAPAGRRRAPARSATGSGPTRPGRGLQPSRPQPLTRVAFEIAGFDRIEIRCDPANVRSAAIPKRLGYVYEATLRGRLRNEHDEPARRDGVHDVRRGLPGLALRHRNARGLRRRRRPAALNIWCLAPVIHGSHT